MAGGFAAGFANTLAGSGSLITLPLLILAGLPPTVANGTNRVAVLLQSVVAAGAFRRHGLLDLPRDLRAAIPAVAGALLGAWIASGLGEEIMRRAIGVMMLAMLPVLAADPNRWVRGRSPAGPAPRAWSRFALFFAIGAYGGFIQAGVGIFIVAGLVLCGGYDLMRGTAVKVLIVLCLTLCALVVFVARGQVAWEPGLVLAAGTMLGAWTAARLAIRGGAGFVRWALLAVAAASAAALLIP
ncbi:MAG: sulfite exporter TauE/SafE family protein [bacterium]|nr:sulfite exporter TauE/SafE family protein [bacterium]